MKVNTTHSTLPDGYARRFNTSKWYLIHYRRSYLVNTCVLPLSSITVSLRASSLYLQLVSIYFGLITLDLGKRFQTEGRKNES